MKKVHILRSIILSLVLFVAVVSATSMGSVASALPLPAAVGKDLISNAVDCSNATNRQSAACSDDKKTDPITGSDGLISHIANVVAFAAGAAATIMFVVGGIHFITSEGDPSKAASARSTVIYALLGIAVVVAARAIVAFMVQKL